MDDDLIGWLAVGLLMVAVWTFYRTTLSAILFGPPGTETPVYIGGTPTPSTS